MNTFADRYDSCHTVKTVPPGTAFTYSHMSAELDNKPDLVYATYL